MLRGITGHKLSSVCLDMWLVHSALWSSMQTFWWIYHKCVWHSYASFSAEVIIQGPLELGTGKDMFFLVWNKTKNQKEQQQPPNWQWTEEISDLNLVDHVRPRQTGSTGVFSIQTVDSGPHQGFIVLCVCMWMCTRRLPVSLIAIWQIMTCLTDTEQFFGFLMLWAMPFLCVEEEGSVSSLANFLYSLHSLSLLTSKPGIGFCHVSGKRN